MSLPVGWSEVAVGDVLESWDRLRVPLNAEQRASRKGPHPYFGANGQVDSIDDYRYDGDFILVAEDGGHFDQPERGVAYAASGKFWVNNHAHVLRPRGEMPVGYFLHALNAVNWMPHVGGSTRLKLTAGSLERVPLALPPLAEQRRIVEKLDEIFAQTRAARARLERLPALIEKLKRSILAAAFRGDLTKDWRAANPDVEPASALLDRIRAERRRRSDDGLRPKGNESENRRKQLTADETSYELPPSWQWSTVEDLADYGRHALKAGPFGSALKKSDHITGGAFKVYGQEQVIGNDSSIETYFINETKHSELASCAVKAGDVLISLVGTIGRALILPRDAQPGIINPRLIKVTLAASGLLPLALKRYLECPIAKSRMSQDSHGGTMEILNLGILRALPIPLAPVEEQRAILERLDDAFWAIDALAARTTRSAVRTIGLEQAALAKAFRGELVPQDPTDEPAAVLLDRIRAERAATDGPVRRHRAAKIAPDNAPTPVATTEPSALDLVIAALQASDARLTAATIADSTGLTPAAVRLALKEVVAAGQVRTHGKARGTTYEWST